MAASSRHMLPSTVLLEESPLLFFSRCCTCWWMIGDLLKVTISFVFPFFSLPLGSTHWSLFLNVSILVFILLISTFFLDFFYKSFIYFQFSPLIKIYHIFFFFQFRFLGLLVKVLLIFDFTIQSKFMMYYFFQLGPHFFFLPFVKVIFLFNLTLQ